MASAQLDLVCVLGDDVFLASNLCAVDEGALLRVEVVDGDLGPAA